MRTNARREREKLCPKKIGKHATSPAYVRDLVQKLSRPRMLGSDHHGSRRALELALDEDALPGGGEVEVLAKPGAGVDGERDEIVGLVDPGVPVVRAPPDLVPEPLLRVVEGGKMVCLKQ